MTVLDRIVEARRRELPSLRRRLPELEAAAREAPPARSLYEALRGGAEVRVIAEHKRRSPSAGWIREGTEAAALVRAYAEGGAAAASVLTEPAHFGGSAEDLSSSRAVAAIPLLRKDFLVDPAQVVESRGMGADAVLLIVRILDDAALAELLATALDWGMDALVEAHDGGEVERALGAGARIVGINSRDLATFRTDLGRSVRLVEAVPEDRVVVGESGIHVPADVDRLGEAGVDAILVGESLMRAQDARSAVRRLAGRARRLGVRPAPFSPRNPPSAPAR